MKMKVRMVVWVLEGQFPLNTYQFDTIVKFKIKSSHHKSRTVLLCAGIVLGAEEPSVDEEILVSTFKELTI